jgi:hypothetical protein
MRTISLFATFPLAVLLGAACSSGDATHQSSDLSNTIDMADYVLPSCASAAPAWQIGSEQFRVVPMGMQGGSGRFVIVKSTDGSGYEEWSVDASWFRIRADTTWAYELPDHTWCDVKCGNNDASDCQQRWNTNASDPHNGLSPSSPWAYTVYADPANTSLGAPVIPRKLKLPMNASMQFSSNVAIQGARRDTCASCWVNFDSPSVGRKVNARRFPTWHGLSDVVELQITSGPGAGEVYDYARGKGWVGFNGNAASGQVASSTLPVSSCAGFQQGSICAATGGATQPSPPPPTPTSTSTSNPPPPQPTACACDPNVNNFCLYAGSTPGCAMTAPGGYCDPNGDGSFSDADWVRGYDDYQKQCAGTQPPPPPPASCPCDSGVDNFCLYSPSTPGCAMTAPGGYCDPNGDGSFSDADWVRGYDDYHQQCP